MRVLRDSGSGDASFVLRHVGFKRFWSSVDASFVANMWVLRGLGYVDADFVRFIIERCGVC